MLARISALTLACSLLSLGAEKEERPMNVILIMADDMGWGDLGCYGATHFKTPACDRLAGEGMRFTDAHSPSAVCTPTRYSVLTGRYAWRSWLKNWVLMENHPLLIDTERLTIGKVFQQAGYRTGCIGKWHLGWGEKPGVDFSGEVKPGVLETGFDEFFGVPYSHNSGRGLRVYMRDRRIVDLPEGASYRDKEVQKKTMRSLEDTATEISKEAVAFIERHQDKPFFLYYPTTNIHFPLTPHERFKGRTDSGVYGEFMIEFDWAVAEVLDTLDRLKLADNTIVIVTSDNGARPHPQLNGHDCNGPWRGTKRMIYEAGHRVPLIVRWPGVVEAGSTSDETVCLTDFMTTFAKLHGIEAPKDIARDSFDILPVLAGREHEKPLRPHTIHHSVSGQFAIRVGDWKLIEGAGDGDYPRDEQGKMQVVRWQPELDEEGKPVRLDYFELEFGDQHQLFNLAQDPKETTNLADEHPERVEEMLALLNAV
ncbi:MAG: arylsulfatase, partial [Akkermansiaceae bacterium]|nr:arylsulfatase [Akkermansiaceae bacterium]